MNILLNTSKPEILETKSDVCKKSEESIAKNLTSLLKDEPKFNTDMMIFDDLKISQTEYNNDTASNCINEESSLLERKSSMVNKGKKTRKRSLEIEDAPRQPDRFTIESGQGGRGVNLALSRLSSTVSKMMPNQSDFFRKIEQRNRDVIKLRSNLSSRNLSPMPNVSPKEKKGVRFDLTPRKSIKRSRSRLRNPKSFLNDSYQESGSGFLKRREPRQRTFDMSREYDSLDYRSRGRHRSASVKSRDRKERLMKLVMLKKIKEKRKIKQRQQNLDRIKYKLLLRRRSEVKFQSRKKEVDLGLTRMKVKSKLRKEKERFYASIENSVGRKRSMRPKKKMVKSFTSKKFRETDRNKINKLKLELFLRRSAKRRNRAEREKDLRRKMAHFTSNYDRVGSIKRSNHRVYNPFMGYPSSHKYGGVKLVH